MDDGNEDGEGFAGLRKIIQSWRQNQEPESAAAWQEIEQILADMERYQLEVRLQIATLAEPNRFVSAFYDSINQNLFAARIISEGMIRKRLRKPETILPL